MQIFLKITLAHRVKPIGMFFEHAHKVIRLTTALALNGTDNNRILQGTNVQNTQPNSVLELNPTVLTSNLAVNFPNTFHDLKGGSC